MTTRLFAKVIRLIAVLWENCITQARLSWEQQCTAAHFPTGEKNSAVTIRKTVGSSQR